jgi:hypothetical protein
MYNCSACSDNEEFSNTESIMKDGDFSISSVRKNCIDWKFSYFVTSRELQSSILHER